MTTVAVRGRDMACDSRITGGFIAESPSKIIVGRDCLVGFCGDYVACYSGAVWLAGEVNEKPDTSSDDDVEFVILRRNGIWIADSSLREAPIKGKFWACGSGATAAMAAMYMGAGAQEAIRVAIKCDEYSGPPAKVFSI